MYDAIIIGGGPAGLNAALVLGRCRRRVLVVDSGRPRNAASHCMHGFLTRDGIAPHDLLKLGREELAAYAVEFRRQEAVDAYREGNCFVAALEDGSRYCARKLLLATGVVDRMPQIAGISDFYGRSVFHCPYCDGWEVREQPLAVYGKASHGCLLALSLLTWSHDLALFTDGPSRLNLEQKDALRAYRIALYETRVARLEGSGEQLERVILKDGTAVRRRAMFFATGQQQHSQLPSKLGCVFNRKGTVDTNRFQATNVPGVYVAGDAAKDVQLVIVAAAEGAKAAVAINEALQQEDCAALSRQAA